MIAAISDAHFGFRKSAPVFFDSTMKFFKEQLIPELRTKGTKDLLILGDLFDVRETINIKTLMAVYDLMHIDMADFRIHILIGNHDIYHSNSNDVNVTSVLKHLPNVTVYTTRTEIEINGKSILVQPWLIDGDEFEDYVESAHKAGIRYDMVVGHFDIIGIRYNEFGILSSGATKESVDPKIFSKITEHVYSGHFHTGSSDVYKSIEGSCRITYLGATTQQNFGDCGAERGYIMIDDNCNYELVQNSVSTKFVKLSYPDEFDQDIIMNNVIQLKIEKDLSTREPKKYDKYIEQINKFRPATRIAFVYDKSEVICEDVIIEGDYHAGTIDELIIEFMATVEDFEDKDIVQIMLITEFNECMTS